MDVVGQKIIDGECLSAIESKMVFGDLSQLEAKAVWDSPDWANSIAGHLKTHKAHPAVLLMGWVAIAKSYVDTYDPLRVDIENDIIHARITLANKCKALSDDMLRMAKLLRSDKTNDRLHINGLGAIQSQGTMIDAECGSLSTLIEIHERMCE